MPSESGKTSQQGIRKKSTSSFSGPDFNNLMQQKRSGDEASMKRRDSIADQYNSGFVGRMWQR
ncbi:5'-3' exoribonuclease 2 [Hypoxylon texense]